MNVFIRPCADDQYQWFVTSAQSVQSQKHEGDAGALAAFCQQQETIRNRILVVPAVDTAMRRLTFSEKEKRHIRKAIPFMLEDELLTEADDIHFVSGKLQADHVDVLAIDRVLLEQWLAGLAEAGVTPSHCVAEYQLLPDAQEAWLLFYWQGQYLVKIPDALPVAFDAMQLDLGLSLLTDNYAELPAAIVLYGNDEKALEEARQQVPDALKHLLTSETADLPLTWQQQFAERGQDWNLLHGDFAPSREWVAMLKPWRWAAAALLFAFILQTGLIAIEGNRYKEQYASLRKQMDTTFRQVVPQGRIVDHRVQLERLLKTLQQGGGQGGTLISRVETIGAVLAKHEVQSLNALNYERDEGELRIDLLVADYDQLQKIIDGLKAEAMTVEIQNSNAQGDQLRARLKVTG